MFNPPVEFLKQCFDYNQDSGILTWRERPRAHFARSRIWKRFNTMCAGRVAGSDDSHGYLVVRVTFDGSEGLLRCHRIAWALTTGAWPLDDIDHKNGDRSDNRLSNLRAGTRGENTQNRKLHVASTSGLTGVTRDKRNGKWRAQIGAEKRRYTLGRFRTSELAYAAYLEAKAQLHPFQPAPRS